MHVRKDRVTHTHKKKTDVNAENGNRKGNTAWYSEIDSLTSLDVPELHESVIAENQFHCTRLYFFFGGGGGGG